MKKTTKISGFVPRRRFGRTEIMMPVISCGGMRLQETWVPHEGFNIKDVSKRSMDNMRNTIRAALSFGVNHFETAQGYGCSELMYGRVFKTMFESKEIKKREDVILQTKVKPCASEKEFRKLLGKSLQALDLQRNKINYIDLISLHGINKPKQLEWAVKYCIPVLEEYRKKNVVKWIGFSTHAMTPVIVSAISTNHFDYINLHYHFIGSYTASGSSANGLDNLLALREARKRDMGVFVISAQDKGGMLYKPPKKFHNLTLPLTPMEFNTLYLLHLTEKNKKTQQQQHLIHTLVVGAARPSDFDEHVRAVNQLDDDSVRKLVQSAEQRLRCEYNRVLGKEFASSWWKYLPHCYENKYGIHVCMIIWLLNLTKAWGLLHYARGRYAFMETNAQKWNESLKPEENMSILFDWYVSLHTSRSIHLLTHTHTGIQDVHCLMITKYQIFLRI